MIRTFFDSGVLIAAARSLDPDGERALQLLEEPNRVFLTSPFVHLEVVPKAIFFNKRLERSFYERYFKNAAWFREVDKIEVAAKTEATKGASGRWTPSTWQQPTYPMRTSSSRPKSPTRRSTGPRWSRSSTCSTSPAP